MRKLPESIVHITMVMAFFMMFLNVIFVREEAMYRGITMVFLLIFGFLILNQLYGQVETERIRPHKRVLMYSELPNTTVLVKYSPLSRYEHMVVDLAEYFMGKVPVLLISSMPRADIYIDGFEEEISKGKIKVVEISTTGQRSFEGKRIRFPLTELEWMKELYTSSPNGSAVIFEPLSDVIMNVGSTSTYKLMRNWLEMCSNKDMSFVALVNYAAHQKEVLSAFEGLFLTIALIEDKELIRVR